jgi:hypothetical protein
MFKHQLEKIMLPLAASGVMLVAGLLVTSPRGLAQSAAASVDPSRVAQGYASRPSVLSIWPEKTTTW